MEVPAARPIPSLSWRLRVKPSLPVGIDTAKLKAEATGPLAAFHEEELKETFIAISPSLAERAIAKFIALQR